MPKRIAFEIPSVSRLRHEIQLVDVPEIHLKQESFADYEGMTNRAKKVRMGAVNASYTLFKPAAQSSSLDPAVVLVKDSGTAMAISH